MVPVNSRKNACFLFLIKLCIRVPYWRLFFSTLETEDSKVFVCQVLSNSENMYFAFIPSKVSTHIKYLIKKKLTAEVDVPVSVGVDAIAETMTGASLSP